VALSLLPTAFVIDDIRKEAKVSETFWPGSRLRPLDNTQNTYVYV